MANPFLKEMTVSIPEKAIIRNAKRVEYELERIYSSETKDSRVIRRVIGKVDPVNPGRMFPNEMYFQLFPENEVPEEVRDEFLRGCEIKRQMREVRSDPDRIIEGVVKVTAGTVLLCSTSCNRAVPLFPKGRPLVPAEKPSAAEE